MGAFARSWEITKLSYEVMKKDKELLLFPLCAGIFSLLFMIAMIFPTVVVALLDTGAEEVGVFEYIVLFIVYLGLALIGTFFNVCVVYTTKKRFEGGDATFAESIRFAFSKMKLIVAWSLVSATVGLVLALLDRVAERMGKNGEFIMKLINSLIGAAWGIVTIFVVPSMVYHNTGPMDAIKQSIATLKKTWGESLIRYYGFGLLEFVLLFLGVIFFGVPAFLVMVLGLGFLALLLFVVGIVYLTLVILFFSVANSIFNTALYTYAETGKVPGGYPREVLVNAFTHR